MNEPYISWKQVGDASKEIAILRVTGREFSAATIFGHIWNTMSWDGETGLCGTADSHEMAKEEALAAANKQLFLSPTKIGEHMYADPTAHKERHKLLHNMLDELLADYIRINRTPIGKTTIMDLLAWSYSQTVAPVSYDDEVIPSKSS